MLAPASPSVTVKVTLTRLRSMRRHRGHDLGAVQAARQVLALELLLGAVGQRLVERQALADADVLQRLDQRVLVELLHADEVDVGDDRALVDDDDEHVAVDVDPHVLEQAGREQRAQRGRALLVVVGVADAKRQRREHGAGVGALQAFDADVLEHERLDRPGRAQPAGRAATSEGDGSEAEAGDVQPGERAGKGMRSVIGGPAGGPRRCRERGTSSSAGWQPRRAAAARATLGDRTSRHGLEKIIHQVSAIEDRQRQQVEHAEAHADQREKAEVVREAEAAPTGRRSRRS